MKNSKNTIIICLTVIICVVISSLTAVNISNNAFKTIQDVVPIIYSKTQTTSVTENTTEQTTQNIEPVTDETTTQQEVTEEIPSTDGTTESITNQTSNATAKSTTKATAKSTTKATTKTTKTTKKTTTKATTKSTTKATTKATTLSKEQIISNYNNAVNKIISSKAGFTKIRTTELITLEGGALMKNSAVKNAVSDFLGVGSKTFTTAKGNNDNISKASLNSSDVKSASYTLKDGKYTYTIILNNGTSSFAPDSNSSPLDRTGLYVGSGDKSAYDHKTALNLAAAINNTDGASVKTVKENSSNGKCVAIVDAKSGKITSLTVSFDYSVNLTTIKYAIVSINSANGSAKTKVEYKDFKW